MDIKEFITAHPFKLLFLAAAFFFAGGVYGSWSEAYVPPAEEAGVYHVLLTSRGAQPDAHTVPVGEYVQINSADGEVHNIGYGHGDSETHQHEHIAGVLDSGDFGAGEAYRIQIKEAGTFYFHDHYNPKNVITVVGYVPDQE